MACRRSGTSGPGVEAGRSILYLHGGGYGTARDGHLQGVHRARHLAAAANHRLRARTTRSPPSTRSRRRSTRHSPPTARCAERERGRSCSPATLPEAGWPLASALALRDADDDPPAGLVLFTPWLDLTHSGKLVHARTARREPILTHTDSIREGRAYAAGHDLRDPRISPLFAESLAGLPAVHVLGAEDDLLVSDADRFVERVRGGRRRGRVPPLRRPLARLPAVRRLHGRGSRGDAATPATAIDRFFSASVAAGGAVEAAAQG